MKDPKKRTYGEIWHEQVENENPVLAFLTFVLGILIVIGFVIVMGTQPSYSVEEAYAFETVPSDKTNWQAQERMDHAYLKEQWMSVKANLDVMKEAASEETSDVVPEDEWVETVPEYYYEAPAYYAAPSASYGTDQPLRTAGVTSDGTYQYTWYSENILPGYGLEIPGRHTDSDGYVRDADENIVVASSDLSRGTEVDTPYGHAKVYDTGCASGVLDVYTNW